MSKNRRQPVHRSFGEGGGALHKRIITRLNVFSNILLLACQHRGGTCSNVMHVLDLSGKSIVVMGGTTGLGLSAARCFVRGGARVVVVGRDPDRLSAARKSLGRAARALAGDAVHPATATQAIELAVKEFGRLDGLYHVAGGSGRAWGDGPLHEMTDEGWRKTLEWNLDSVAWSNRAALRRFLAQGGGGSILNMGSVLADSPSPRHFSTHAYAAAKAAIVGLSKSVAACYAGQGIRCNVIEPALMDTPMAKRAASNKTIMRFLKTKQPLDGGRIGQPADLDGAAAYFMSDASKFTTGQVLAVDGGWCLS
jgi:NAD(P)-dependent dehydrogenase (short-subunit alcohol dehydrogenase family)